MKIVIAGDGKVGTTLTRQLASEGYDLTLIDMNSDVLEATMVKYDVMGIQGNCASMDVLLQAGIKDADLLIATTSADEMNLLCCITAHGLNPNLHTIARIRNPEYFEQIYKMSDLFALSLVVNPEKQAASEIERLLRYPGFLKRETFAKGRVEIVELKVDARSKLCNRALNDLDGLIKCKVLVCAVLRNGVAFTPDGNFVLREGDRIFVTASTNNLTALMKNLGILKHKVKRVILCGGGRVSYYLAQGLQKSGITVQIIEKDKERCRHLSEKLPNTYIVHGDASNEAVLDSEGIMDCDALVSMTGMDELNMMISLYGGSCQVPQIITKLGHMGDSRLVDSLEIGSVIRPKDLCSNTIVRYVRAMKNQTGAALAVHTIAEGQVEALEFLVDEYTMNRGIPLKNLSLKKNVLVACIIRGVRTEFPNGDSVFKEGDHVIIVSSAKKVLYQLNDIFE